MQSMYNTGSLLYYLHLLLFCEEKNKKRFDRCAQQLLITHLAFQQPVCALTKFQLILIRNEQRGETQHTLIDTPLKISLRILQGFVHQQLFIEKTHLSNKITVFVYKLRKYFVSSFNSHSPLGLSFHWEILYCQVAGYQKNHASYWTSNPKKGLDQVIVQVFNSIDGT